MTTQLLGFHDSTILLKTPEKLRLRAKQQGVLFFRGLLPRELILELRRQFLQIIADNGWLDPDADLMEGIGNPEAIDKLTQEELNAVGVGVPPQAYIAVQKLPLFHQLAHHPNLINLYKTLFGTDVFPHPRNIARLMLPSSHNHPTPAHQDYIHIQGTENVWTAWIPVGDCPRKMGNLTVLPQSHGDGILPPKITQGAGNLEAQLCGDDHTWIVEDFQAGDVLTFHSLTVHKSLPPTVKNRVRLSCDYRFQPLNEPIEEQSLQTHCGILPWEEVYRDWSEHEDGLKYYWKNKELIRSVWDESIRWQKERICN